MNKITSWAVPVVILITIIMASLYGIYRSGAEGARIVKTGSAVSFDRQYDQAIFEINNDIAFAVDKNKSVNLVKYTAVPLPVSTFCGVYRKNGGLINLAHFSGDWLYSKFPSGGLYDSVDAYNLKTGEKFVVKEAKNNALIDITTIDFYKQNNFTGSAEQLLTPEKIAQFNPQSVSSNQDSCNTLVLAGFAAYGIVAVAVIVQLIMLKTKKKLNSRLPIITK